MSAGGVVYRLCPEGAEIVVCGRLREDMWRLPKGTPEQGETLEHAALREVGEETGLDVEIESKVGSIQYRFRSDGTQFDKTVEHYLMRPVGGSIANHDGEFDAVRWVTIGEALKLLHFANERSIVRKAGKIIRERQGS